MQKRLAHSEVASQAGDLQVSRKAPPDPNSFLREDSLCLGVFLYRKQHAFQEFSEKKDPDDKLVWGGERQAY